MENIESFTSKVQQLAASFNSWNKWANVFIVIVMIALACLYFTQYMANKKAMELSKTKDDLGDLKDKRAQVETEHNIAKVKSESNERIEKVKADADERIALLNAERDSSRERVAKLNNETERLKADNLLLQKVMMPRHVGLIGIDEQPKAKQHFSGIESFAGTEVLIQFAPDLEAQNLANEIAIVLQRFGWKPQFIDERRSHVPPAAISEGINVLAPSPLKMWKPDEPEDPAVAWIKAGDALAGALTKAGLGVGKYPVSHGGFVNESTNPPLIPYFSPPLKGVYVKVGSRPIGLTLQLMEQRRKATIPQ
jgi:uncharacterized small protein (DUF1192 family)